MNNIIFKIVYNSNSIPSLYEVKELDDSCYSMLTKDHFIASIQKGWTTQIRGSKDECRITDTFLIACIVNKTQLLEMRKELFGYRKIIDKIIRCHEHWFDK